MERDLVQKMRLMKLFWSWGYLPDIDVKLVHAGGSSRTKFELTDVDVLGFKISSELTPQRIAGDCKTKRSESPINRAFWLYGIMGHLGVDRGLVVLSRSIELDHKLAAQRLGITLMNDEDFELFMKLVLPPDFPHDLRVFSVDAWTKFFTIGQQRRELQGLWYYRRNRFWYDSPQRGLRYSLMEVRSARRAFEQRNYLLTALFTDAMTAFAVSLSHMLAELFQVYLVSERKDDLDQQLKSYVYGGWETYEHLNSLAQQLVQLRKLIHDSYGFENTSKSSRNGLSLPEWDQFIQLFRSCLDAPVEFFKVPQLLRYVLFEWILRRDGEAVDVRQAIPTISNFSVKLALDLLRYYAAATQVPEQTWHPVRDVLDEILVTIPSRYGQEAVQRLERACEGEEGD